MASDLGMSLAFVAVGLATQGGALLLARRPIRLLRAGGSARGTVLDNEESMLQSGRGAASKFYFPLIGFTTAKDERIRFTSAIGRGRALPKGSEVRVLYDPAKPDEAELATFKTLWAPSTVTAVFGLPFLAAGLIGLF
jgi:hypothetical protein